MPFALPPEPKMSSDTLVAVLRAGGEPTRLRVLALLAAGDLTVKDLTAILGQSQPRISRHLKLLTEAELVDRFPEGSWVYYRLREDGAAADVVRRLLAALDPDVVAMQEVRPLDGREGETTADRLADDRPVSPAYLFAALLWHEVLAAWQQFQKQGERPIPAMHAAMDDVLAKQKKQLAIPHRHDAVMKEIWLLQQRFEQRAGQRPYRLLEQPRFRAGFDFLLLRCASNEVDNELGLWWDEFQDASEARRQEMLQPEGAGEKKRRRRKPRKKPDAGSQPADQNDSESA